MACLSIPMKTLRELGLRPFTSCTALYAFDVVFFNTASPLSSYGLGFHSNALTKKQ